MTFNNVIPNNFAPATWSLNGLVFDAWLRLQHDSSVVTTDHPVETGGNISDNSYLTPLLFSIDIGVTDSPTNFITAFSPGLTLFQGAVLNKSLSIGKYLDLLNLQVNRTPSTLICKYATYKNIIVTGLGAVDTYETSNSLRATLGLKQIIVASPKTVFVSVTPQLTDQTNSGQVTASPVPTQRGPAVKLLRDDINAGLKAIGH